MWVQGVEIMYWPGALYLRVLLVFLDLARFHAEHVDPFDGRTWLMWIFPSFGKFVRD